MLQFTPTAGGASPSPITESAIEQLVHHQAATALDAGAGGRVGELARVGALHQPDAQLEAVRILARGLLATDVTAVNAVAEAIMGRSESERNGTIATLGKLSAAAGQAALEALEPLVERATHESSLAPSLVRSTRETIEDRQGHHRYARWVTGDPDGFSRWVWTLALRAAGERIWDRSWMKLAGLVDERTWATLAKSGPQQARAGWRSFDASAICARDAAVGALVDASLTRTPGRQRRAWIEAMGRAQEAPGALTWAHFANLLRAEIGTTAWNTATGIIADQVAVLVNDLPWIAGPIGLIALAAEASIAPVRTAVVVDGARTMNRYDDFEEALRGTIDEATGRLARTA